MSEITSITLPKYRWKVLIPNRPNDSGGLVICYENLSLWQRLWMRFIGWGVRRINDE